MSVWFTCQKSFQNEDEETEQDNSVTDRENEAEESVEELIERAENMIRENTQHCNHVDISETTINDYIQPFLAEQECYDDNNLINSSGPSTIPAPNRTTVSRKLKCFCFVFVQKRKIENVMSLLQGCHYLPETRCPISFRLIQTVTMK